MQSLFLVPCLIKRSPCSPKISKLVHFSLLWFLWTPVMWIIYYSVISEYCGRFVFFSRELSPSDSIATVWVIKIASECVDTFPFWEDISASKLSTTVSICLHHSMWCIWYSMQINICCPSCCPRGLALASRILEDTSWRSWPWMIRPWPWHLRSWSLPCWEKSLGLGPRLFSQDPGHMVTVRVCCAHTHGVTWQSVISCSGIFHRLAFKLDVGGKVIWICEVRAVWCQCV